ncbi:MAG: sulfotransferase domain-containing protein [Parerythrobacter sp.]
MISLFGKKNVVNAQEKDIFLVSYPKSGNTWLRFMVANLLAVEEVNFYNVHEYCPEFPSAERKSNFYKGTVYKSHELYNPIFQRVVYLVRDPRDVYVSYYHYLKNKNNNVGSIANFIKSVPPKKQWDTHVSSWINAKMNRDEFLIIRYEDLKIDTFESFKKVVNFCNFDVTDHQISDSVGNSSFNSMKLIERKHGRPNKTHTKDIFVRKGKVSQWENELGETEINLIMQRCGKNMKRLGYE